MTFFQNTLSSLALAAIICTVPFFAKAQKIFEGNIYYKLGMNADDSHDFFFSIKNGRARIQGDITQPVDAMRKVNSETIFIGGNEPGTYVVYPDSQKTKRLVRVFDLNDTTTVEFNRLKQTIRKRSIAGIVCTGYEVKKDGAEIPHLYIWIADSITLSKDFDLSILPMFSDYFLGNRIVMGLSMLVGETEADLLKVVRLEQKQMDEAAFLLPEHYQLESLRLKLANKPKWVFE